MNQPRRNYTFHGSKEYRSGWEKMVLDKFNSVPLISRLSLFTLFGLGNLGAYGLSLVMDEKDYRYYFTYRARGEPMDIIRSSMGSDRFLNIVWTAPSLIILGQYMHKRQGALNHMKFSLLTIGAMCAFYTAFTPSHHLMVDFREKYIPKYDCIGKGGSYYMGADFLAMALIYNALLSHGLFNVARILMIYDVCYYGPQFLGAPTVALLASMIM